MNNFKGGEGAEGGRKYLLLKIIYIVKQTKTHTKKSHNIFNILKKHRGRISIYIDQRSVCFISKAKKEIHFYCKIILTTLQHNLIKQHLFVSWLGVHQTSCQPYFFFSCESSRETDNVYIFRMCLRPGKRKYQILTCAISNKILMDFMLYFGEAITEFFWFSDT